MKIGIVLDSTLDSPDGVQQFVLQIGAFMTHQGHEVHYIVGESHRTDLDNIHSISKNVKVAFNGNIISSPMPITRRSATRILDDLDLDIIHVNTPFSPLLAGKLLRAAKKRGIPVVSTFHILPYGVAAKAGNIALGLWLKRYRSAITISTAVSKPAATYAERYYGLRSRVIPNPINVSLFCAEAAQHSVPTVVFLGRLVERKGCMKLLEALAYMRLQKLYEGPLSVIIGGKGQLAESLQQYCRANSLDDVVKLVGFVAEEDKASFLAAADIAVFPSMAGESFGISLLEAFAAASGVVLAGDNPGYASVVPDDKNLITPRNSPNFARALAYWLTNETERTAMAVLQKRYVQDFDIQHVGAQFEATYNEALQTSKDS